MASSRISTIISHQLNQIWLSNENFAKLAVEVHHSLLLIAEIEIAPSEILNGLHFVFPSSTQWKVPLLEFELLPWLVDVFSMINLGSTEIKKLARGAHHFCRQVHGRNLHRNKIHGI
jgi:hypothetical protein